MRRGRQPRRAHTSLPAIESTATGQSRGRRKGLQSQLQPHTADGGGSAGLLEKPATLASSELGDDTHSADVEDR